MTTSTNQTDSIASTGDDAAYTNDQLAQMFNTGMHGDTEASATAVKSEDEGAKPGAPADNGEATKKPDDHTPAATAQAEAKAEEEPVIDPANTVLLAKDGKHTIDFSHLEKARKQSATYKAERDDALSQLAQLQAQAQARAEAGQAPTKQDQLVQQAQAAVEAGVDPEIFGDFDEQGIAKGIFELNRQTSEKLRAEVKAELMQELRAELAPVLQQHQQDATTAHVDAILKAHPEASSILESTEFAAWQGTQPSYVQDAMKAVLEKGSTQQVIELIGSYKAAAQPSQSSQSASQSKATEAAAQKVVGQLKTPVPNSPSDIPGGTSGGGTLAERLSAMSEVELYNAVNSGEITEEQLNRFLSRKS